MTIAQKNKIVRKAIEELVKNDLRSDLDYYLDGMELKKLKITSTKTSGGLTGTGNSYLFNLEMEAEECGKIYKSKDVIFKMSDHEKGLNNSGSNHIYRNIAECDTLEMIKKWIKEQVKVNLDVSEWY